MKKILLCIAAIFLLISCENEETLNGLWKFDDDYCVEIKKDKGYFVLLNAEAWALGLSNFLGIGDLAIKNLKKTGDNRWSGKEVTWWEDEYTGKVLKLDWDGATYILSEDKKSLTRFVLDEKITLYKVDNVLDNVPAQPYLKMEQIQQQENADILKKGILKKINH